MAMNKVITGAHYGLKDWLAQRVTAVIMAIFTLVFLVVYLMSGKLDYGTWANIFAPTWMKVLTVMAFLSLGYHAWIGLRDIFMDYIQAASIRLILEVATILALVGYGVWAVAILWRV
jgi:succinate dehydrogenase / fumarate reductase, membrane anchor subunit